MSGELVIGHNAYRYRVVKEWGNSQAVQYPVKDCHEMVKDKNDRIFLLTNETKNNILIYNKDGKITGSWGNNFPGGHGLSIADENGEEFLFITDCERHEVIKTTLDGKELMVLSYPKEIKEYTSADQYKPTETAIAPNGDLYVTDGYGLQFVIQYNYKGEYIRHWGGRDGFDCAHGIAIDDRGVEATLLVTSRNHNSFKRFTMSGEYINTIHLPGSFVCRPVVHNKNVYAAVFRSENNQLFGSGYITVLDENDHVVSTPGGTGPLYIDQQLQAQKKQGDVFIHPHDVCVDDDENMYVAQWNSNRTYPIKLERIV